MELRGRTKNDVLFWFAKEHGKHPNMVDAILGAVDFYGVEVHVTLSAVRYVITTEDYPVGDLNPEETYKIASVT